MARKKRRNRGVVLLVMLLVLGGIFLLYRFLGQMEDPQTGGQQVPIGETNYIVSNKPYTDIRELSYTWEEKTLSFTYNGEKAEWKSKDEPNFPLSGDLLNSMAACISSVSAIRKLEGDTGEYGFEHPTLYVNVSYTDGTSMFYNVGSYNGFADGYYLKTEKNEVYLVSKAIIESFRYSLEDMLLLDQIPADYDENELVSVIITDGEGNVKTVTNPDDILELSDVSVRAIPLTEWDCAYATHDEQASLYGISDSSNTLTLVYLSYYSADGEASAALTERSFTYCFGNTVTEEEEEKIYFSLLKDGSDTSGIVYQMDLAIYETILSVSAKAE